MGWKEQSDNRQVLYDSNDNLVLEVGDDSSLYNKAGTQILSGNGGSIAALPIAVEDYGAVGDGTTDDTTALQAAFATGRDITLKDGKTYLHRRALAMGTAGQILDGRGSTLKRAAQVTTTTTSAIVSGVTTSITLASVVGLVVGDQMVCEKAGTYDVSARTIQSIVGSVVTFTTAIAITSASGTVNVRTSWNQISVTAADCHIFDLVMDGNSSNWTWGRWNHMIAVNCSGTGLRALVEHCRIINQYGDGFAPAAAGWTFAYNDVETLKGRGVVFSGNTGQTSDLDTRVVYNRFLNCNLDTAVGASDGLGTINFSQGGPATLIHGNYIDGGSTGIGAIHSFNSSNLTITDNEFWNLSSWGIDGAGGGVESASVVSVHDNRLYGCGISVDNTGNTSTSSGWNIHDNHLYGGQIKLALTQHISVHDNHLHAEAIGGPLSTSTTVSATGGTFAAGTYYYRVTATNSAGESTGSTEVSAVVGLNGSVSFNWKVVPGANGYKLYRTTVSGTYTPTALLTTITGGTTYSYTDTGTAVGAGALPSTDTTMLTTLTLIDMGAVGGTVTNAIISGNQLHGGQNGIRLNQNVSQCRIDGNLLIGQYTNGITFGSATGIASIDITNNTVIGTVASASGSYTGMNILGGPMGIRGNRVDWTGVVSGSGAITLGSTASKVMVEENIIIGGSHGTTLTAQASSADCVLRNNHLDHAISDSGTRTIRSGNRQTTGTLSGRAVLVAGTVTISTAEVIASDNIQLTCVLVGGTQGILSVGTIVAGTSFVINSSNAADTSTVYWKIDH